MTSSLCWPVRPSTLFQGPRRADSNIRHDQMKAARKVDLRTKFRGRWVPIRDKSEAATEEVTVGEQKEETMVGGCEDDF